MDLDTIWTEAAQATASLSMIETMEFFFGTGAITRYTWVWYSTTSMAAYICNVWLLLHSPFSPGAVMKGLAIRNMLRIVLATAYGIVELLPAPRVDVLRA